MTLQVVIVRGAETTQVSCILGGNPLTEFYGFGPEYTDEEIEAFISTDLGEKGYAV